MKLRSRRNCSESDGRANGAVNKFVPQLPQNLKPRGFSKPQFEQ
jgi:hypothetical protein